MQTAAQNVVSDRHHRCVPLRAMTATTPMAAMPQAAANYAMICIMSMGRGHRSGVSRNQLSTR